MCVCVCLCVGLINRIKINYSATRLWNENSIVKVKSLLAWTKRWANISLYISLYTYIYDDIEAFSYHPYKYPEWFVFTRLLTLFNEMEFDRMSLMKYIFVYSFFFYLYRNIHVCISIDLIYMFWKWLRM